MFNLGFFNYVTNWIAAIELFLRRTLVLFVFLFSFSCVISVQ